MKILSILIFMSASVFAQLPSPFVPAKDNHFTLDVKAAATKSSTNDAYKTDWGSYDKTTERERKIEILVHNLGRTAEKVTVHTYWIARTLDNKSRSILRRDKETIEFAPGSSKTLTSVSGAVKGRDLNYALSNYRYMSGHKIDGWIVMIYRDSDNKILIYKSANSDLAALAAKPVDLEKLPVVTDK